MPFRENTYNEGQYYQLVPCARMDVVPGQSLESRIQVKFETAAFVKNIMSGGVAHLYAFYTPYRLCWDEWVDFASDPSYANNVPTCSVAWPFGFERTANSGFRANCFGRRSYKLIYNQFFGSKQWSSNGACWYDDPFDDADVTEKALRGTDQLSGKLLATDQAPDATYAAPVTGTSPNQVATVSLNEFRRQLVEARSKRRADMTGDKYVDAMRRMGVNLDWRVQMAPEFLGQSLVEFDAVKTRGTYNKEAATNTVLGQAFARYQATLDLQLKRKFIAEHGIVWFVLAIRPYTLSQNVPNPLSAMRAARSGFFFGDNQAGVETVVGDSLGVVGDSYLPRFQWLKSGQNLIGKKSAEPWLPQYSPTTIQGFVYPPTVTTPNDGQLGAAVAAVWSRLVAGGPTPVKTNQF